MVVDHVRTNGEPDPAQFRFDDQRILTMSEVEMLPEYQVPLAINRRFAIRRREAQRVINMPVVTFDESGSQVNTVPTTKFGQRIDDRAIGLFRQFVQIGVLA
jgi:hypothetical protein